MSLRLSKRLKTIIAMCDKTDMIVDIATDHGKVPITLANIGVASHVIATDINEGPLNTCRENAKLYLKNKGCTFETLICDGLKGLDKKKKLSIIITGIGYDLMCEMLTDIDEYNIDYMILSPHTKPNEFVKFLVNKKIDIIKIQTVFEDDKCYFIFKCKGRRDED